MNNGFYVTWIVLIPILTATFLFGMMVGRETAPQPQTISWDDQIWTHRDDLSDNLTPATQEYVFP